MRNQKPIYAILQECAEQPTEDQRIACLKYYDTGVLRAVLAHMFDPTIVFDLPEGKPPYKPSKVDDPFALYAEARKFYIFVKWERQPAMAPAKREYLFTNILEGLNPEEAELLCLMKDKKSPNPLITETLIRKAFPDLLNEEPKI